MREPEVLANSNRRVAVVLSGEGWDRAPFADPAIEIWTCNDMYELPLPRIDRLFELHAPEDWYCVAERVLSCDVPEGKFVRPLNHAARLTALSKSIPVYMQQSYDDFPDAIRFPLEDVTNVCGHVPLFDSSLAFMVGFAILERIGWLGVFGANMAGPTEYARQRPNAQWLLGIAFGRGVRIAIGQPSTLLTVGHLYAYERGQVRPTDSLRERLTRVINARERIVEAWIRGDEGRDMVGDRKRVIDLDRELVAIHEEIARVGLDVAGMNTTQLALLGQ